MLAQSTRIAAGNEGMLSRSPPTLAVRFGVDFVSNSTVLGGLDLTIAHLVGIFTSVAPETIRTCEERDRPGNGCDYDVAMVSVDHIYHVRSPSAADLPPVLKIITETPAGRLPEAAPAMSEPTHRREAAWEHVITTTDLTVYLVVTEAEA